MRPVIMEMDGFASFRQRTVVDFQDVDYFALVGQTGAGKSTIIDAIAFALYGQVARWDDARAVAPALAPTVNRGTVKLVFDVQGDRYIAIREVRRAAKGNVTVKTARLERLDDPTALGEPNDTTVVIEDGEAAKFAVEELLGLDFNQFTKCVALPQGAFAEFLHAKGSVRDAILTKLLGIDIYLQLGQLANSRAHHFRTQADALRSAIDTTVDISEEAFQGATTQVTKLDELQTVIGPGLASLGQRASALADLSRTRDGLQSDVAVLGVVRVPEGLEALDQRQAAAEEAVATTQQRLIASEATEATARTTLQAHPARASLTQTIQQYEQQAANDEALPHLINAVASSAVAQQTAATARTEATAAYATAEAAERTASELAEQIDTEQAAVEHEQELLLAVKMPKAVIAPETNLDGELAAAQAALTAAREVRQQRRDALASTGDVAASERASGALVSLISAITQATAPISELATTHEAAVAATVDAEKADAALTAAKEHADALRERSATADLREHLAVGQACPVCEQAVHALPAAIDNTAVTAAGSALDQAQSLATSAGQTRVQAKSLWGSHREHAVRMLSAVASATETATRALALLDVSTTLASPTTNIEDDDVTASQRSLLSSLEGLKALATNAQTELAQRSASRAALEAEVLEADNAEAEADTAVENVRNQQLVAQEQQKAARQALASIREPLLVLGAPAVDESDLAGSWGRLGAWADERQAAATTLLKELKTRSSQAAKELKHASAALATTSVARDAAQASYDAAVKAGAEAAAALKGAEVRREELAGLLASAEPLPLVRTALTTLDELEAAHSAATGELALARVARNDAEDAKARSAEELAEAGALLTAARDPLVTLGAPALHASTTLGERWGLLATWAGLQLTNKQAALTALADSISDQEQAAQAEAERLRAAVEAEGILCDSSQDLASWVPARLATELTRAQSLVQSILDARDRASDLQRKADDANEQAIVAKALGSLLGMNKFPRWITRSALEVLVVAASETLLELSAGQFELTLNEKGEFTVIDHNDADAERMVKTLSGGETFQASLALALALSTHLGALAAEGAAQLEAIFIDEGFGTLDEQTLDVVATTLENLANSAGRMVGVITHVPSLAARVPVRFNVSRDRRGSSVTRVPL